MKIVARIFQHGPISLSQQMHLDEKASHHLNHVLRVKCGDKITLFNGEGGEYQAVIKHIDKKGVVVLILSYLPQEVESPIQIHLAQGIARGEKMDFIIQKAVELGVNQIIPVITERSLVKLNDSREKKRLAHWQAVIISACEQSGRNRIPNISSSILLKDWLQEVKGDIETFSRYILLPELSDFGCEEPVLKTSKGRLSDQGWYGALSKEREKRKPIVILIGPEGGFSEQEMKASKMHGFYPLNLGPRTLRTETASIACIAILQYCFGDMDIENMNALNN